MPSNHIPKNIFQTASDADLDNPAIRENIEHLKNLHPDYRYRLFTHQEAVNFVLDRVAGQVGTKLRNMDPAYNVIFADLFRYLVVHEYGGLYLDIKSSTLTHVDEFLQPNDEFVLSQWNNGIGRVFYGYGMHPDLDRIYGGEYMQWFVMATPKHRILKRVIQTVCTNIKDYSPHYFGTGDVGVWRVSGPIAYSLAIAPMLPNYRTKFIDAEERGLVYSIFEDVRGGHKRADHYSNQTTPIFDGDKFWHIFKYR